MAIEDYRVSKSRAGKKYWWWHIANICPFTWPSSVPMTCYEAVEWNDTEASVTFELWGRTASKHIIGQLEGMWANVDTLLIFDFARKRTHSETELWYVWLVVKIGFDEYMSHMFAILIIGCDGNFENTYVVLNNISKATQTHTCGSWCHYITNLVQVVHTYLQIKCKHYISKYYIVIRPSVLYNGKSCSFFERIFRVN